MNFQSILVFCLLIVSISHTKAMQPQEGAEESSIVHIRVWNSARENSHVRFEIGNFSINLRPGIEEGPDNPLAPRLDDNLSPAPYVLSIDDLMEEPASQIFSLPLATNALNTMIKDFFKEATPLKYPLLGHLLNNVQWSLNEEDSFFSSKPSISSFRFVKKLLYAGGIQTIGQTYQSTYFKEILREQNSKLEETINKKQQNGKQGVGPEEIVEICEAGTRLCQNTERAKKLDSLIETDYDSIAPHLSNFHFQEVYDIARRRTSTVQDVREHLDLLSHYYNKKNILNYFSDIWKENISLLQLTIDYNFVIIDPMSEVDASAPLFPPLSTGIEDYNKQYNLLKYIEVLRAIETEINKNYQKISIHLQPFHFQNIYNMVCKQKKPLADIQIYLQELEKCYEADYSLVGYLNPFAWGRSLTNTWKKN